MGDNEHYYSVEGSQTESMINLPYLSNVGTPGKFVFRVDLTEIEPAPTAGLSLHFHDSFAHIIVTKRPVIRVISLFRKGSTSLLTKC